VGDGVTAMGYNSSEQLIAVVKAVDNAWKPEKVFN
jgi:hypothetical protein